MEESVVLLGVVQDKQGVDDASPYVSKAGGIPAWYSHQEPKEAQSLICPKCNHRLFLVAQVYAPVDADRSLYVFGCNSPECTETSGSWRVLRDQVTQPSAQPVAEEQQKVVTPPPAPTATSGWDAGDDDSDWSDVEVEKSSSGDMGGSAIDIEALLQQRDDAMKSTAVTNNATTVKAIDHKTMAPLTGVSQTPNAMLNVFPALPIEVINEPYEDYVKENDYSHENELLQAYMKSEEEEKSTDVSDLRRILSSAKKGDANLAAGGATSGESYERTPAQLKHFQRFQKRINRCPLQVLRYDYGGEPLWPTPVQKNKIKVPRCVCDEERAFEMQLTPTINYFLKVDDFAHKKLERPQPLTKCSSAPVAATAVGGGMDWSSVVVYSCPKSCSRSTEEFVYVLPSQS